MHSDGFHRLFLSSISYFSFSPLILSPSATPFLPYFCFLVMYIKIILCAVYNLGATKRENLQHLSESGAFCLMLISGCICFLVNKSI